MNKQILIKLRCRAWGITEDEYYCNQCSDFSLEDMARAYRRGKNKGRADNQDKLKNLASVAKVRLANWQKYEKEVEELRKEVELWKKASELNSYKAFQFEKENKELAEENAELKERLKEHENVGNSQFWKNVWSWENKSQQLTKAKRNNKGVS